ncbi:MAG: DUF1804 family protein [Desulfovibrio sp.]|jgi:hypothetical protein|nr:DUF1804 family protein [Desulfovibrio sp.]
MAHKDAVRAALRSAYVFDRLGLEQAAIRTGVAPGTAARWKRKALAEGDDWDKLRAASLLAGEGVESVARQMLADYIVQHKTLMESIAGDAYDAAAKVSMLASLADSFNKTVAASKRVLPETNELAVALEVLSLLGAFVRDSFPAHAPAFLEIVEPFGHLLSQHFGKRGA